MTEIEVCQNCKTAEGLAPHPCPYQSDVNDDSETECNCCESCQHNCADEI